MSESGEVLKEALQTARSEADILDALAQHVEYMNSGEDEPEIPTVEAGPSPANFSSACSRRAPSNPKDGLESRACETRPIRTRSCAERHDRLELTRWPDEHLTSCRLVQRLSRVWVASVGQVQMRHRHNEPIALHGGIVI